MEWSLYCFLALFVLISEGAVLYRDQEEWDHYIFAQQYPAGVCLSKKDGYCDYPPGASSWTIHGLWPTLGDTREPNNCNKSAKFSGTEIQDLVPKLTMEWTNLFNTSTVDYSFWEHEWIKHGTCSPFPDEHAYFMTVLDLFEKNRKFADILQDQGVVPSNDNPYSAKDILTAFKAELGVEPYSIICEMDSEKVAVLTQIGLCLDKNTMQVTRCPSDTLMSSCQGNVHYTTSKN